MNFLHKFNNQGIPRIFNDPIKKPVHKYPTNFSKSNFCLKNLSLNSPKYSVSFCGPKLWNEILHKDEKELESYSLSQNRYVKIKITHDRK